MTDLAKLKERASEAFAKGRFAKAGELYEDYCQASPKDLQSRLRMGDAWARAHQKDRAIVAYQGAAEGFAKDGFLPRAIAASKLILELDPAHQGVQQMLADLYARRGFGERRGGLEAAHSAAAHPAPAAASAPPGGPHVIELPEDDPSDAARVEGTGRLGSLEAPVVQAGPEVGVAEAGRAEPKRAPKVHTIELEPDEADELSFAQAAPDAVSERPTDIAIEVESGPSSIGDSLASVASTGLEAGDRGVEIPIELEESSRPAAPPARAQVPAKARPAPTAATPQPAPASAPPPAAKAVPSPETVPLEVDEAEVATEILGKLDAPRPMVPGPPPPPSRIVSSGHVVPPGLRRKTESELPAAKVSTPSPAPDRHGRSELRASLAAFSVDESDPGLEPLPSASDSLGPEASLREEIDALRAAVEVSAPETRNASTHPPARPSWDTGRFTELELTSDSLLHAVELAAHQAGAEEPVEDSPSDEAPPEGALPQIPLFSDLPHEAFIALFERSPLRRLGTGDRIITQGTVGDAFYVICEGEVRVVREDHGQTRELARLAHGSFFGEMALLSGAPRTASVESASDDTQVLEISAPVLAELSKDHPQIATALRKFCRQRMLSNVMESSALFRPFAKKDRRALIEKFRAREVKPGDVVIQEGQRSDGLYVVLAGEVEVCRHTQVLAHLKEGELFGEMSLLEKAPASATVKATKRTSLLRLPREAFDAVVLSHPQILVLISELTEDRRRRNEALTRTAPPSLPDGDEPLVLV